jgi:hypothetical protein
MTLLNRLIFFLIPIVSLSQENLMNYNNSLKFARYLTTTMQYDFATQEYERLNFVYPNDSTAIIELVKTYRLGNKCEKLNSSLKLLSNKNRIQSNKVFTKEYLNFKITCQNFDDFNKYTSLLNKNETNFYNLSQYWISNDYEHLHTFSPQKDNLNDFKYNELVSLTKSFNNEKYKKPGLAVLMSAIVPGSGKAYSKRWTDAVVSFIFVGTNTFAAYRAFSKKGVKSTNGWIFGTLAFSFYSANLWGSYKAAKEYNNHIKHSYRQNAENIIYSSF